jgi:pyridoxal phosphate enzyme (YggS family)
VSIAENVTHVRERIAAAAQRAGRDPASVTLVGVTKDVVPEALTEALAAGLSDFGENYIQEAETQISALGDAATGARWHFIGHLQTNKAKTALGMFDLIHSVDSLRLAQQLSRLSVAPVRILLEVNVAEEASKFGLAPDEVGAAVSEIGRLPNLDLAGLMTVAPASAKDASRVVFRELRDLASTNGLAELSMGMSNDFEVAVEEGATLVRIGRAIFGERPV